MGSKQGWDEALGRIEEARKAGGLILVLENLSLDELPLEVFTLGQLRLLKLGENRLRFLPDGIWQLSNLQWLYLENNLLSTLPESIGKLANLEHLHVYRNQLTALPKSIGQLTNLQNLQLFSNKLSQLPETLGRLKKLETLNLVVNQLTVLPPSFGELVSLAELDVQYNPLTSPPPEIVAQGTKAILGYLRSIASGHTIQRRVAKVVLVGEPKAGKTTLFRVLGGKPARADEDQTHGIKVEVLELPHPLDGKPMRLNTWDFGGQHIYHATHQFFLTDGALFVLVWNSREGVEKGRLTYWLDMITARAPSSPILLVSTGLDQHPPDIDFDLLGKRYRITGNSAVSCTNLTGIPELRDRIAEITSGLRMMKEQWHPDWVKAAADIRTLGRPYVSPEELFQTLTQAGVPVEAHQTLVGWLCELGDIVYHGEDNPLGDLVVLEAEWIASEISRVLESTAVRERRGILARDDLQGLWPGIQLRVRDHLLRMMDHYDLTYNTAHPDEIGIVVECLPHAPTEYRPLWDGAKEYHDVKMRFQFRCELPPGIPTWFIAREHRFTTHNQWRDGALFRKGDDLCLIQTTRESRDVSLCVRGPNAPYFFGVMSDGFDQTLDRYPGLAAKLDRFVPCSSPGCTGEFNYANLHLLLERSGANKTIQCHSCFGDIPLSRLLYAIPAPDVVAQLQVIEGKLDRGFEATTRQFTLQLKRAQNERDNDCPAVFSLHPRRGISILPTTVEAWAGALRGESIEMELCLFCEYHGKWHPTRDSVYYFKGDAKWLEDVAPYWKRVTEALKIADFPGTKQVVAAADSILKLEIHRHAQLGEMFDNQYGPDLAWGAARVRLRELLRELDKARKDPATQWGGLNQVLTPEGEVLWVCPEHKAEIFPFPRQPLV